MSGSTAAARVHPRTRLMSETLAAKWAELVSQALLLLLVPRALGPAAYGEFAIAFGAVSLLSLGLGLGAPLAAVRYVPAATEEQRLSQARAIARSVAVARVRVLAVLTVAALAIGPSALDVPLLVVVAVCAAAWCSVASSIAGELALAIGRPRLWNARFPVENMLVVAGALAGHAASGTHGAIVGMAAGCVGTLLLLGPRVGGELRRAPEGDPLPPEAVGYARFQTLTVILGTLTKRGGTLAMPVAGASSAATAFAAIATGVGAAGAGVMMSLLLVQLPPLARRALHSLRGAEEEASRSARDALVVAMAAAVPAALLAGPAIEFVLGSDFADARSAVALALPALPLSAALGLASVVASLRLQPSRLTASWGAAAIAFLAIAAATIPSLDADGAALALTGGLLTACLTATALLGGRAMRESCLACVAGAAVVLAAGAAGGALV